MRSIESASAELLAAIDESADLVELCALALPLQVAGAADAAHVLDLWAPAAAALGALDDAAAPAERAALAALRSRVAQLGPALAALRAACG